MLWYGVTERVQSDWSSTVTLVPKFNESWVFCTDYRLPNAIKICDVYSIYRKDEYVNSLGEATWFSTLDGSLRYQQVPIAKVDCDKTTFTYQSSTYRFWSMPFRLNNPHATFQRALVILLSGFYWRTWFVYLNDVIVLSKSFDTHLQEVKMVQSTLWNAGVLPHLEKWCFFTDSVKFYFRFDVFVYTITGIY